MHGKVWRWTKPEILRHWSKMTETSRKRLWNGQWKMNATLIHSENRQKSSKVITAMFTCVSVYHRSFFFFRSSLCVMNWGMMDPSLATSLSFLVRVSGLWTPMQPQAAQAHASRKRGIYKLFMVLEREPGRDLRERPVLGCKRPLTIWDFVWGIKYRRFRTWNKTKFQHFFSEMNKNN